MFMAISNSGMMTVPNGSMCASGLNDRRPALLAVGSPSLYAAKPCDISCRTMAGTKLTMEQMRYGKEILDIMFASIKHPATIR